MKDQGQRIVVANRNASDTIKLTRLSLRLGRIRIAVWHGDGSLASCVGEIIASLDSAGKLVADLLDLVSEGRL